MKLTKPRIAGITLLLLGVVAAGYAALSKQWSRASVAEANAVVERAAARLNLRFAEFNGPTIANNGFFGSSIYEWERRSNGQVTDMLTYDPFETHVCWSQKLAATWKQNGCITTQ